MCQQTADTIPVFILFFLTARNFYYFFSRVTRKNNKPTFSKPTFGNFRQKIVGNHALLALLLHRRCNFALDDPASSLLPDALSMCHGGSGYTPETITRDSKIEPRMRRTRLSEAPDSFLGAPKSSRDRPWRVWRRPRVSNCAKRAPTIAQSGLKLVRSWPPKRPSWDRRRPSWRQVGPKSAQVEAKRRPIGAQEAPS